MKLSYLYITASNKDEAHKIARLLLQERLVACVNIIEGVSSLFWWNNAIQSAEETILIAKTKNSLIDKVVEKVKTIHSYECPCIVSVPIEDGYKPFLEWIAKETAL